MCPSAHEGELFRGASRRVYSYLYVNTLRLLADSKGTLAGTAPEGKGRPLSGTSGRSHSSVRKDGGKLTQTPQDLRKSSCVTGGLSGKLRSARSELESKPILASSRTVDTIAAGTLAMMDMTGLRSSIMKMVARRFDKNL
jgi:hypothetical protein